MKKFLLTTVMALAGLAPAAQAAVVLNLTTPHFSGTITLDVASLASLDQEMNDLALDWQLSGHGEIFTFANTEIDYGRSDNRELFFYLMTDADSAIQSWRLSVENDQHREIVSGYYNMSDQYSRLDDKDGATGLPLYDSASAGSLTVVNSIQVPEPGSLALVLLATPLLALSRRRSAARA